MRENHHGTEPFFVLGEVAEGLAENLNELIEGPKDAIVQIFLTQFLPEMFNGIDFWTRGRLKDQANVFWHASGLWPDASQLDRLA